MNTDEIRARAEKGQKFAGSYPGEFYPAMWTKWINKLALDVLALLDANAALGAYLVPALESEALAIDNFYAATDRAEAAEAEVRVLQSALEDSPTGLAQRALAAEAEVVALRAALEAALERPVRTAVECDGSPHCQAPRHLHGCFAETREEQT